MLKRQSRRFSSTMPSDFAFWLARQNSGVRVPSGNSQQMPTMGTTVLICPVVSRGLGMYGFSLLKGLRSGGNK